jgi:hypothetical protein
MLNKNEKGMLLFPSAASMIAEDTNGPMNADVFPTFSKAVQDVTTNHPQ